MAKRNILLAATWATGAFALVMAAGLPISLNAGDEPVIASVKVAQPKLTAHGIVFTVERVAPTTQPSDSNADRPLTLRVRAENRGDSPAKSDFALELFSSGVARPMGRTLSAPRPIWQQRGQVTLDVGQSKTMDFTSSAVPAKGIASVMISVDNQRIQALSIASTVDSGLASK